MDAAQPFGLRSTSKIFNALVDGLMWIMEILLDTVKHDIRLPADKLSRLKTLIQSWSLKKCCTKENCYPYSGSSNMHAEWSHQAVPS